MSAAEVRAAVDRLAATRRALRARPVREIARALGEAGERFLDAEGEAAREAIEAVARETGLSGAMSRRVVLGMARDWTRDRLSELLEREFTDPAVLDSFVVDPRGGRRLHAVGDPVAVHIGSGSVPGVSTTSMIRSLLVKTPVLVKPGSGDLALTRAFHRTLGAVEPGLAASATVRYWSGDDRVSLEAAVAGAARVVVYGSDASVRQVVEAVPVHVPVTAYHHRVSVAILGTRALSPPEAGPPMEPAPVLSALARAACTFDQRGCVSPHRVFLLGFGGGEARRVGEELARAMAREAWEAPPGTLEGSAAARLQQLRADVGMRAAVEPGIAVWASSDAAWTVVLDPDAEGPSGHPRTLTLVPVADLGALRDRLLPLRAHLQSVGVAGVDEDEPLVRELADLGATRIGPLAEMPFPPAWWVHDGAGPLRALIRWVEWTPSSRLPPPRPARRPSDGFPGGSPRPGP